MLCCMLQLATWIERVFGRKADANLCVTHVMQQWLQENWQIEATVLHDKPPLFFKPTPLEVQHELFSRVGDQISHCNDVCYIITDQYVVTCNLHLPICAAGCSSCRGALEPATWRRRC